MKTIFIMGFMGSGKTTIGKALSHAVNIPVIDTDEEIVRLSGKSIAKIFEEDGEQAFRTLEAQILKEVTIENRIITTGGGMVLQAANRSWMKENGVVVFLDATPSEILKRLNGDHSRPLLNTDKRTKVHEILEYRMSYYLETAHIRVDTTGKTVSNIVDELINRLKQEKLDILV